MAVTETFPVGPVEPPLMQIGNITITRNSVVVPQGRFALRGTVWTVQDYTVVSETIPTYAIVLAIFFAAGCLLGLLFLLIKEQTVTGFVAVTVVGDGFYHSVQLPPGAASSSWAMGQVHQARTLAATA